MGVEKDVSASVGAVTVSSPSASVGRVISASSLTTGKVADSFSVGIVTLPSSSLTTGRVADSSSVVIAGMVTSPSDSVLLVSEDSPSLEVLVGRAVGRVRERKAEGTPEVQVQSLQEVVAQLVEYRVDSPSVINSLV